jgi:hypothetical protein
VVSGRIGLAHGCIASVRAVRLPLVPSLAASFSEIGLHGAPIYLDREHYPHLRRLAFAYAGASMVGSWLGNAT